MSIRSEHRPGNRRLRAAVLPRAVDQPRLVAEAGIPPQCPIAPLESTPPPRDEMGSQLLDAQPGDQLGGQLLESGDNAGSVAIGSGGDPPILRQLRPGCVDMRRCVMSLRSLRSVTKPSIR